MIMRMMTERLLRNKERNDEKVIRNIIFISFISMADVNEIRK